jgi:hypothetical protein
MKASKLYEALHALISERCLCIFGGACGVGNASQGGDFNLEFLTRHVQIVRA